MNSVSQAEKAGMSAFRERGDMGKAKTTVPSVSLGKTLRVLFYYLLFELYGRRTCACMSWNTCEGQRTTFGTSARVTHTLNNLFSSTSS